MLTKAPVYSVTSFETLINLMPNASKQLLSAWRHASSLPLVLRKKGHKTETSLYCPALTFLKEADWHMTRCRFGTLVWVGSGQMCSRVSQERQIEVSAAG